MIARHNNDKNRILELNEKQRSFYNTASDKRDFNVVMEAWRRARRNMYFLLNESGIWHDVYSLQKEWMGDLSGKKVLDFGCYAGNALSGYLASHAEEYWGIDLSDKALASLEMYFRERNITGARLQAVDILSDEFSEKDFDIIYAQGVIHHFNPIDVVLSVLQKKLKVGGRVITLDPQQTTFLTRSVRAIYHPFRVDKEWEWPFTRRTYSSIRRYFDIIQIRGFMGLSKWAIPLAVLNKRLATNLAATLHKKDFSEATREGPALWRCMQVIMCWEKNKEEKA